MAPVTTARIAVDAMGGDYAPTEVVRGCLAVAQENPQADITLVGDEERLRAELHGHAVPSNLRLRHAPQVIEMGESVKGILRKRDASIVVCARMVQEGEADALFSAGHSGGVMAAAVLHLGRIPGIDRPAIAAAIPSKKGRFVLIDAGANVDCDPAHLLEFAIMGSVYAQVILNIPQPTVALLSNGEEESKGNQTVRQAHRLLRQSGLPFLGNIEGKDVFDGRADVVVCDGFVGNVALKIGEGTASFMVSLIEEEVRRNPLLMVPLGLMKGAIRRLKQRTDYAEYGGAHLLGVRGVCVIGHGRSHASAIANGVRLTVRSVQEHMAERIESAMLEQTALLDSLPLLLQESEANAQ
ncbi:MAG: phosphate acyltransferase PlsX [Armatimonadota bacterium]|nr:phosphate acyltransferase PlsX [bacterium]MCS7309793.1 phosphate acyltransferase PlsX [Armatimonadota bacterium]MDW8105307.1 phosphate acyltransferase PlsX [Armatimonadota bacterium]MDW8289839.1 phosphate acyltransferase PlsX [Armatimonadota bacterium]